MPAPYMVSVAGTTFEGRQEVLQTLFALQQKAAQGHDGALAATLEREPDNRFDANAIKVIVAGKHIGYVPGFLAAKLAVRMSAGEAFHVATAEITHGVDSYRAKIVIDVTSREAV